MLLTYDNNQLLHLLHFNNHATKNKSDKNSMNKTFNCRKGNDITEINGQDKINQLFKDNNVGKKYRDKDKDQGAVVGGSRDFIRMIQFFRAWNNLDKLLSGLPSSIYKIGQTNFEQMSEIENSPVNLTKKFKQKYLIGKIIGEGAYASVRVGICKQTQQRVALKVYQKANLQKLQRKKSLIRQIRILSYMNHQNIVKILNVAQTNNHLNIIMQYLNGISLSQYLKKTQAKKLSQQQCKIVIRGIASALQHMNNLNISHRDIKVQNVLLDKNLNPKLIDFGFSTCIQKGKKIQLFCGTPNYMAPQIVLRKQFCGMKADIWALGVLFFIIATGSFPFRGTSDEQLYSKIVSVQYPKQRISDCKEMSQLISMMLKFDPEQRISPSNILNHPWISGLQKRQVSSSKNKYKMLTQQNLPQQKRKRINTTLSIYSEMKIQQKLKVKNIKSIEKKSTKQYFHQTLKQKDINKFLETNTKIKQSSAINTNSNIYSNLYMKKSKNNYTLKKQISRQFSKSKQKENYKERQKNKKLHKSKSKTKLV